MNTPHAVRASPPKVSVCVVTYNHERYIAQCLQSLVDQQVDFDFEVIVCDDCSTDRTPQIVAELASRYPRIIRSIRHSRNIGAYQNFVFVHELADGTYVSHVDGDDYAMPGKLQAQADFLDRHPECQIVWHKMLLQDDSNGSIYPQIFDEQRVGGRQIGIEDLICNITVGLHSSKMYRRWSRPDVPDLHALDFSENVLHLHTTGGYAAFVEGGPYGVYRVNMGISRKAWIIREKIYLWLKFFYERRIADRSLLFAKLFLMVASDFRRRSQSFRPGLKLLASMAGGIVPVRVMECRRRRFNLS